MIGIGTNVQNYNTILYRNDFKCYQEYQGFIDNEPY